MSITKQVKQLRRAAHTRKWRGKPHDARFVSQFLEGIREAHPFTFAHEAFLLGQLTIAQAVAMVTLDGDFEWEALCDEKDVQQAARDVVENVWRAELVARIQADSGLVRGIADDARRANA